MCSLCQLSISISKSSHCAWRKRNPDRDHYICTRCRIVQTNTARRLRNSRPQFIDVVCPICLATRTIKNRAKIGMCLKCAVIKATAAERDTTKIRPTCTIAAKLHIAEGVKRISSGWVGVHGANRTHLLVYRLLRTSISQTDNMETHTKVQKERDRLRNREKSTTDRYTPKASFHIGTLVRYGD